MRDRLETVCLGGRASSRAHTSWETRDNQGSRGRSPSPPWVLRLPRSQASRRATAGFTLAEVLAALVFMAILIPVALEGLSIASRAGEVAARKSDAALVAERILNESVVTTNWNQTIQSGTLRQGILDFRWTLHNEAWNGDPYQNVMRLLTVEVKYTAQGQDYSVRLSTLANSPSLFAQTNSAP